PSLVVSGRLPPPRLFPYTTLFRSLRSRERRGRGLTRRARPADRLEEFLEAMGRDEPHHHEVLGAVVHDLVLDVVAEEAGGAGDRSEEHTSELQSRFDLVCRLLLEK